MFSEYRCRRSTSTTQRTKTPPRQRSSVHFLSRTHRRYPLVATLPEGHRGNHVGSKAPSKTRTETPFRTPALKCGKPMMTAFTMCNIPTGAFLGARTYTPTNTGTITFGVLRQH